jgi:hypothetical protein
MRCARYVYTAAAWIALWRRTAHLSGGFDVGNVDKNIDRRIDRKSDDIGHKRRPIQYLAASHKRDRLSSKHRYFPVAITGLALRIIARNRRRPSEFHLFAR